MAEEAPPRSPMWISLPSVSIMMATAKPFSWFSRRTRSMTSLCHSLVPWHMLIRATFMPPTARASSCSNPHVAGPTVHTSFVLRVLRNPFSFSSASVTASTSMELGSEGGAMTPLLSETRISRDEEARRQGRRPWRGRRTVGGGRRAWVGMALAGGAKRRRWREWETDMVARGREMGTRANGNWREGVFQLSECCWALLTELPCLQTELRKLRGEVCSVLCSIRHASFP